MNIRIFKKDDRDYTVHHVEKAFETDKTLCILKENERAALNLPLCNMKGYTVIHMDGSEHHVDLQQRVCL